MSENGRHGTGSVPLSLDDRVDLACEDFERAWKSGRRIAIEEFLADVPPEERPKFLQELLAVELELRVLGRETFTLEDYAARFPGAPDQVLSAFQRHDRWIRTGGVPSNAPRTILSDSTPGLETTRPANGHPRAAARSFADADIGDYEILGEIARGGMGVVYKARQRGINRIVALKMTLAGSFATEAERRRFLAEAQAAGQLDHPNIVPIHEVGEYKGQPYFSMGYVEGKSLKAVLDAGPLAAIDGANIVRTMAEAVHYAHMHGVIHRDLKPANVLIDSHGQPRVTDFGLAKRSSTDSSLTATGQVLGTPSFMPPEQAQGKIDRIGPASDVYALGATLYSVLTGRPPFQAETVVETLRLVVEQDPVPVRDLAPAVPKDLETICLKCLAKEPAERYASAEALSADLSRFLIGDPILGRREPVFRRLVRRVRRNPLVATVTGGGVLALVIAAAIGWIATSRFQASRLLNELDEIITSTDLGEAEFRRLDGLVLKLESASADQAAAARGRIAQRFGDTIRNSLESSSLAPETAARIESQLAVAEQSASLAGESSRLIPGLRAALHSRLRHWDVLHSVEGRGADFDAVFAGRHGVTPPATDPITAVRTADESTGGREAPGSSRILTTVAGGASTRAEAEFLGWENDSTVGLVLDGHDGHPAPIDVLTFLDEHCVLTGSSGSERIPAELRLSDPKTGRELARRELGGGRIAAVASRSREEVFVSIDSSPDLLRLDRRTLSDVSTLRPPPQGFVRPPLAVSVDGSRLTAACGLSGSIELLVWDLSSGEIVHRLPVEGWPSWTGWSADGAVVHAAFPEGRLVSWKMADGQSREDRSIPPFDSILAIDPEARHLLVRQKGREVLWDVETASELEPVPVGTPTSRAVFPGRDRLITCDSFGTTTLWSIPRVRRLRELRADGYLSDARSRCEAIAGAGELIAVAFSPARVELWEKDSERPRSTLGADGYDFVIRAEAPSSTTEKDRTITAGIFRNGLPLVRKPIRVPSGKLRLKVSREGNALSLQVNDLAPLKSLDAFPLSREASGRYGIVMSPGASLARLQLERRGAATRSTELEAGDELAGRGEWAQALERYRRAEKGSRKSEDLEARYKQAVCLAETGHRSDSLEVLESMIHEVDEQGQWPVLAACQVWLILLEDGRFDEADAVIENLAHRFDFEKLALAVPERIRSQILQRYSTRTMGMNLLRHDPNRVRDAQRIVDVIQLLAGDDFQLRVRQQDGAWELIRAYHAEGEFEKLTRYVQDLLRRFEKWGISPSANIVEEYAWVLTVSGRPEEALAEIDRYLFAADGTILPGRRGYLIARARALAALDRNEDAEAAILNFLKLAGTTSGESEPDQLLGWLVLGYLRERAGNAEGAQDAWARGADCATFDQLGNGFDFQYRLIAASFAGRLTPEVSLAVARQLVLAFGDVGKPIELSGAMPSIARALQNCWQTSRGREFARRLVLRERSLPELSRELGQVLVWAIAMDGALGEHPTAEQEQLAWDETGELVERHFAGRIPARNWLLWASCWKGVDGIFGWAGLMQTLDPLERPRVAYLMGQRRLRQGRPDSARHFFAIARDLSQERSALRGLAESALQGIE